MSHSIEDNVEPSLMRLNVLGNCSESPVLAETLPSKFFVKVKTHQVQQKISEVLSYHDTSSFVSRETFSDLK